MLIQNRAGVGNILLLGILEEAGLLLHSAILSSHAEATMTNTAHAKSWSRSLNEGLEHQHDPLGHCTGTIYLAMEILKRKSFRTGHKLGVRVPAYLHFYPTLNRSTPETAYGEALGINEFVCDIPSLPGVHHDECLRGQTWPNTAIASATLLGALQPMLDPIFGRICGADFIPKAFGKVDEIQATH